MCPAGNSEPVTAGIYCRISKADDGDYVKTDDQERICRGLAAQLGWELAAGYGHPHPDGVYTDHSKTAWQKNRKRPAWDQMLADVKAGRINGIIVYHGDRLVRRPEDLADLIRLADSKGVRLASPSGTKNLDSERLEPWIRAAFAEEESQRLSERRKAQYDRWRRQGRTRPGGQGGRAYGFASGGLELMPAYRCDVASRKPETEADTIREMAGRVLAGETRWSVGRDLTARGWRTPSGGNLTHAAVTYILKRERTAGLMPDGESKGAWEPILDRPVWERVRLVLDAKTDAYDYTTNVRRWLLSGIALCGVCGEPLTARRARRNKAKGMEAAAVYGCVKDGCRKVQRSAPLLDAYVTVRTVARLANPLNPEGEAHPADTAAEWEVLQREHAQTQAQIADYTVSAGMLMSLRARLDGIDARMAELREREAGDARSRLLAAHQGITVAEFKGQPLAVQRALVAACFRITVLPASKRGPGFRTEDVELRPL